MSNRDRADALADTAAALLDACHGEPELRAAVLSLLAIDARLDALIDVCLAPPLSSSVTTSAKRFRGRA